MTFLLYSPLYLLHIGLWCTWWQLEFIHTHILNTYTYRTMAVCSGNSHGVSFAGALPPPGHPKSPFPRMLLSCGASPWELALNPHPISGINQLMVEKMVPTICWGSLYALPPMFSKVNFSFATLSVRNRHQAALCAKAEMLSGIGCEKRANLLCFIEAQSTMKSSKGATWLPLSGIYLKVIKRNIKWQ